MATLCFLLAACGAPPVAPDGTDSQPAGKSAGPSSGGPLAAGAHGRKPGAPIKLPPPETSGSWKQVRLQAAHRLVAANPDQVYTDKPPDMLLAIPVLSIELNADGSVRQISVLRYPSQARDTVNMAMQAVRRAAPFGNVSHLPKPWKFNETFLFNEERRFKPMTLDLP